MSSLDAGTYSISFGNNEFQQVFDWLEKNTYSKVAILCDTNTNLTCLPKLQSHFPVCVVAAGEPNKNLASLNQIWRFLMENGLDRDSLLINLGGGMITDIGGFAASTFMRGMDFVNLPTSLLGMVDASVGGKTGIDFYGVKNLIGAFSEPKAIWIFEDFLKTLPARELAAGKAEMIKHGLIADLAHFEALKDIQTPISASDIRRSVEIKSAIVTQDNKEKGLRKTLNFGHTLGHAIESFFLKTATPLLHGEAIFLGMYHETHLSKTLGLISQQNATIVLDCLRQHIIDLDAKIPPFSKLLPWMRMDKKNNSQNIDFSLLTDVGECKHGVKLSEQKLASYAGEMGFKD